MPELPEVETSKRGIQPHIQGEVLQTLVVRQPSLRWPVPIQAIAECEGQKLELVSRRGKYILLKFASGTVILHLGMSGNLRILQAPEEAKKHDHIDFVFQHGVTLRLNDPRRFGCCLFSEEDPLQHPLIKSLGPEPFSDEFSFNYFFAASRNKKKSVKQWLMDSKVVVGVGNIYASESLYLAGINPKTIAGKISLPRMQKLYDAVVSTLAAAIEQGGTTLKDFVGSDGKPGYFKQQLHVYGREGEPCDTCSRPIKQIVQGQRSSFYCSKCQR